MPTSTSWQHNSDHVDAVLREQRYDEESERERAEDSEMEVGWEKANQAPSSDNADQIVAAHQEVLDLVDDNREAVRGEETRP